jgi:hypothetical protein
MVYRLLARFRESRDTSSLLPTRPGRKTGGQMLKKAQERIISDLIRKVYLSKDGSVATGRGGTGNVRN